MSTGSSTSRDGAEIGARDKTPAFSTNVEGTRNVLETAGELAVGKIVYTSTLAVFSDTGGRVVDEDYYFTGKHISVYDATKWKAHYEVALPLMRTGLPAVIVQPGAVYGPGDRGPLADTFVAYLRRRLPLVPQKNAYCWGHVADTARAHLLAMERGRTGESYIIAGPCHELSRVLALLEQLTGIPLPRLHSSPRVLRTLSRLLGPIDRLHRLEGNFFSRDFAGGRRRYLPGHQRGGGKGARNLDETHRRRAARVAPVVSRACGDRG